MNGIQKVIKYCAMAFAVFLSVVIFGAIVAAATGVVAGVTGVNALLEEKERINLSEQYSEEEIKELGITDIFIDCNAEIVVERGEVLAIKARNVTEDYSIQCVNGKLSIVQDSPGSGFHWIFPFGDLTEKGQVLVTIPESFVSEQMTIYSGSGTVSLTDVTAGHLDIGSGSGKVAVANVTADTFYVDSGSGPVSFTNAQASETILDTGSGSVTVEGATLGKLSLNSGSGSVHLKTVAAEDVVVDSGSGSVEIAGRVTGACAFKTGSGSVSVAIDGAEEEYRVEADCGSGTFRINGKKRKDGSYGKAVKGTLSFDSGSGSVNVTFHTPEE